ncbi:MAG TPA: glycoside hydrolase family 66 protein [Symbiobacteriaceae bacterium]|nr:glycoside hydrolase family 66 protein [Symbiobacteriaceae bacterium]
MRRVLIAVTLALGIAGAWVAAPGSRVVEIYPREGMVKPGEAVHLEVRVERVWYDPRPVTVMITRGLEKAPVATLTTRGGAALEWAPPAAGGYGVTARIGRSQAATAVDAGENWAAKPRYGFLSDFAPTDKGQAERFDRMARYHINGLQFYDWHYRHSDYLPPTPEYRDPLGRLLSRDVLLEKLSQSHQHGMAAMAYTAVYAAPKEFADAHKEWGLYNAGGAPLNFGDGFLYIMNPEAGSPWAAYTVDQYRKIVTDLPFDGIHLDQFGDPRMGFRYPGREGGTVDVATAFRSLIDATKDAVAPRPVLFNDVGAWSLQDTADTKKDAVYIEVWPPYNYFDHLQLLIGEGRRRSGGKPVVLAAYIKPENTAAVLLSDAVIFAAGGYHLELGEGAGILADPYFPKYQQPSAELAEHLRRYYDVIVRYQDLLYAPDLVDWAPDVTIADTRVLNGGYFNGVWPVGRSNDRYGILHLINLNGLTDAKWNGAHKTAPPVLEKRAVTVAMAKAPGAVYLISPDDPDQSPVPVRFTYKDGQVQLTLERLAYWDLLVFEK